ncbi:hypothetical protein F5878DRAFT_644428 [Lentinula raphanica]|uniref:Uncharacterized protein n=1 Tax=Lentinula raphanica TaxID=153919 RepID=A0AA38P2X0_9AGAR|nr:hypothetical protein F5878DRAFT_644428 [Lentinula raphanica]
MSPFIQQPHSLERSKACIPTFDHGLHRFVYVDPPVNKFGDRVQLTQVYLLRKKGGIHWEYYCPCAPPPDQPGIPARTWEVQQTWSRYYGNVYLGCGRTNQRCTWKICLNRIYAAQDRQGRQSRPSDEVDSDNLDAVQDLPTQHQTLGTPAMSIDAEVPSQQSPSSQDSLVPSDATDHDFEDEKFDEAFVQLMQELQVTQVPFPRLSEEELAQWFRQLKLSELTGDSATAPNPDARGDEMVWNDIEGEWQLPAHSYEDFARIVELCAAFAGYDDVLVTPDGSIHFIPKSPQAEGTNTAGKLDWEDNVSEDDQMVVDLTLDEYPLASRKPVDLTVEEPQERGDIGISGAGTSTDPYEFIQ